MTYHLYGYFKRTLRIAPALPNESAFDGLCKRYRGHLKALAFFDIIIPPHGYSRHSRNGSHSDSHTYNHIYSHNAHYRYQYH